MTHVSHRNRREFVEAFPEGANLRLTGVLEDAAGNPISAVNTITVTWYDRATGTVINGRNAQNINGVNGGSVDGSGNFVLELTGSTDLVLINKALAREVHVALIEFTYGAGKHGVFEYVVTVENLVNV